MDRHVTFIPIRSYCQTSELSGCCSDSCPMFIVVDEAHCVVQRGHDFRPKFMNIDKVRSVIPDRPILAMTATAGTEMQKLTKDYRHLSSNARTIFECTVRCNIECQVKERPASSVSNHSPLKSVRQVLQPYIKDLYSQSISYPLIIVYTKLEYCAFTYEIALQMTGNQEFTEAHFTQYHASCTYNNLFHF